MFAILSDIHSNLEALSTVLADIEKRGIREIYCLGDVVGYGPNPIQCLDLIIERAPVVRAGKPRLRGVLRADQLQLRRPSRRASGPARCSNCRSPDRRAPSLAVPGRAAHAALHHRPVGTDEGHDGVRPRLAAKADQRVHFPGRRVHQPREVRTLFEKIQHVCFIGHTHMPGVFLDEPDLPARRAGRRLPHHRG